MGILAKNIRSYRVERGLSQERLAELTTLHRTYISAVEREKRNISLKNLEKIAIALGVRPHKLLIPEDYIQDK